MKPIEALSLGWRTDLIFPRFDAHVIGRPDCVVVWTPQNPSFWWGNCLLFDHAPRPGDAARWLARFDDEIVARNPGTRHVAFGVDCAEPFVLPDDFAAAGFELGAATVLTLRREQLRAPRTPFAPGYRAEVIDLDARGAELVELQLASDEGRHPPADAYRLFRRRQLQRYLALVQAGRGQWFAVVADDAGTSRMVADCGLFTDAAAGATLGRYQFVSTHPAWRRRGLCGALIHAVALYGFETLGLAELVIVADPDDVAIGVYESVGFQRGASTWQLQRPPGA